MGSRHENHAGGDPLEILKQGRGLMKAAIYCRLSEEDRNKLHEYDDSNSIQNQKTMLIQYALGQGWAISDIYSDDDYAGSDRSRPQFKRLIADAQARKFDIILCKTQSRFTRELELVEKYIHGLFPIWGIRFVSIVDNADTDNKGNKKSRQIYGLVNEWYLEDMSDNIRSVLTSRREHGYHIGAFAPYGYKKDPELHGHLIIDEEAAAVVKEIFTLFASGYGKSYIARMLNDRGEPNPTEYKRQHGFRYKMAESHLNTLWKYPAIAKILTNEVYIGHLVQGRAESISYKTRQMRPRPKSKWIRVQNTHEPIIDRELWDRVQRKVKSNAKPFENTGMFHPFSGKVVCMYCGYHVRAHKNHNRHYLQCTTRLISRDACRGSFMPVLELEEIVLRELRRLCEELLDGNELARNIDFAAELTRRAEKVTEAQNVHQKKLDACVEALSMLYKDKVKGIISEDDYTAMAASFSQDRARMEDQIAQCRLKLADIEREIARGDNCLAIIEHYVGQTRLTAAMAEILIDHIEIGHRDRVTKQVPVTIFWAF